MKSKLLAGRQGFSLIELIVVLIIVGVLASISVSSYYSWIVGSKSVEALQNLSTYKDDVEGCLDSHIGQESICDALGRPFLASPNWTYKWGDLFALGPTNTAGGGPTISACVTSITAVPSFTIGFNFPLEDTAYASGFMFPTNSLTLSRAANGTWSCKGVGFFQSVC